MPSLRLVPSVGRSLEITEDRSGAVIGRSVEADFTLEDGSVSRRHARLEWRETAWHIVDLGSANGTFVDGERVGESPLAAGQEVRFGTLGMRVELGEPSGDATVAIPSLTAVMPAYREPLPEPETENIPDRLVSPPPPPPPPEPAAQAPPPPVPPPPASAPAPEGGSPVGQMPAPPPAPAKGGRSPLFWALTGCFGCFTALVLLFGAIGGGLWWMTRGPAEDARAQLVRIGSGDVDGAYAELAESYRARLTPEEFAELVRSHPALEGFSEASFTSRSVENDTARVAGSLTSRTGGVEPVVIELVQERGEWRIAAIRFGTGGE